jgi:hypothetical protein
MKTDAQEFADELSELRAIVADYQLMKRERDAEMRAWRKARRELVDLLVATADPLTLERVLAHMEKTICAWERWPASRDLATPKP